MNQHKDTPPDEIRPVGAWVVGAVLLVTIIAAWAIASAVFVTRS